MFILIVLSDHINAVWLVCTNVILRNDMRGWISLCTGLPDSFLSWCETAQHKNATNNYNETSLLWSTSYRSSKVCIRQKVLSLVFYSIVVINSSALEEVLKHAQLPFPYTYFLLYFTFSSGEWKCHFSMTCLLHYVFTIDIQYIMTVVRQLRCCPDDCV